jgi:hypothetical protein
MNKFPVFIASAVLLLGIGAAAIADTSPQASTTTKAPAAPTIGPKEDQRAIDTSPRDKAGKPTASTHKHAKKHKPATSAPLAAT